MIAAAAQARFPASPGLLRAAATMMRREGRQSESIEMYRRACKVDALSEEAWLGLTQSLESGQAAEAVKTIREAASQLGPTLNLVVALARLLVRTNAQQELRLTRPDI